MEKLSVFRGIFFGAIFSSIFWASLYLTVLSFSNLNAAQNSSTDFLKTSNLAQPKKM